LFSLVVLQNYAKSREGQNKYKLIFYQFLSMSGAAAFKQGAPRTRIYNNVFASRKTQIGKLFLPSEWLIERILSLGNAF